MTAQPHKTHARNVGVIIVAAGRGVRAGLSATGQSLDNEPKQYRRIGAQAVIAHTLQRFLDHSAIRSCLVVIHRDDEARFRNAVAPLGSRTGIRTTFGGDTRQISVRRGLEALADDGIEKILVHDGARPFVGHALIDRVLAGLEQFEAVVPALPVTDTLKLCDDEGRVLGTRSRTGLYSVQTPQGFAFAAILDAHRRAANQTGQLFTDDASIAEWAGMDVQTVEGSHGNVKLTTRDDIAMADGALLADGHTQPPSGTAIPDVRTGHGYDVHALAAGGGVTLCGIFIAGDRTLVGHSDADVGYHALTDALLATCGAGDIGDHFPPSDPQWRGAPSHVFLSRARDIVAGNGGIITHADVSLIAEAPRISPHRLAMRQSIARDLGLDIARCSVKATTNEAIGFIGRREGIAALATATVVYKGVSA